ncbi:MAG: hypothetical protein ISS56_14105 [Anaerolineae bacterium]|nr:hypothetical protein [Anaerolineae bacterium]
MDARPRSPLWIRNSFLVACLSAGAGLLLLLSGCGAQRIETEVQDHALTLYLRGYVESCTDDRQIHVRENGTWRRASFEPPGEGRLWFFYLR